MKDLRFAKFVLFVNAAVPAALLAWDGYHHRLGANPINFAILTTGLLTLIFLGLTLLVTPLRKFTGFSTLFHFRRMLGLYAFFYGMSHFLIFFALDQSLNVKSTISEMIKRPYLVVGSIALFLMIPLAATSFNAVIKRMGPKKWQWLHRLVYITAALGAIHYYMQVKADIRQPVVFAVVIGLLLAYRPLAWLLKPKTKLPATAGKWTGQLRVKEIIQETPDVKTFRLASTNAGPLPFTYLPGQYLSLTLDIAGKKTYRSYTIASTPSRPGTCELSIKRDPMGVASQFMHDHVHLGDLLNVSAPGGRFTFTGENTPGVLMLAGGVGITPLMSMIRYLADRNFPGQIHLLYANKSEADIIFRNELADLSARHPNLHVTHTLTRSQNWTGVVGRIDAMLLSRFVPDHRSLPAYICGPNEMLHATRTLLQTLGVPDAQIHSESFGVTARPDALSSHDTPHQVTFARSKKSATVPPGQTLLEAGEALDIPIDFECRSGICGRCRCKLVDGAVTMAVEEALDNTDRENNMILMCQARPTEDVTVDA